jgi:hypothetical protein
MDEFFLGDWIESDSFFAASEWLTDLTREIKARRSSCDDRELWVTIDQDFESLTYTWHILCLIDDDEIVSVSKLIKESEVS